MILPDTLCLTLTNPLRYNFYAKFISRIGGVAQLGERLTGSQEVRGSIPLVSTRALNEAPTQVGAFFHINRPAIYLCLAAVEVNPSQIATMNEINALRLCKPK